MATPESFVSANDNSVAIGRVDNIGTVNHNGETLNLNVENLQVTFQATGSSALDGDVRNASATADAILLGPLTSTDAQVLLDTIPLS